MSLTWKELSEAINKLPEEEQNKKVKVAISDDDTFREADGFETIPEDVYQGKVDFEDAGDLKTLKDVHEDEFNLDDYELSTAKGTAFIWID